MSIEIHDSDLIAMLMRLDYDNWFSMLPPIADRFREIGEDRCADRVEDFIVERKRPHRYKSDFTFCFIDGDDSEFAPETRLKARTVSFVDDVNDKLWVKSIRSLLLAYLQVPERLRIERSK